MDDKKFGYLLVVPVLIILLALNIYPLLYNVFLSAVNWQIRFIGSQPVFAGLANYLTVLTDGRFYNDVGVTLTLLAVVVPVENFLGLGLAYLVGRNFRGGNVVTGIIIIPLALSSAVVGMIWKLLFFCSFGPIDYLLETVHVWNTCANPLFAYPLQSIMVADIWRWTPFFFLIYLAGLSSMPREPLEAARVDGASSLQILRFISIRMLAPLMGIAIIIRIMDVFKTFGVPFIMTNGGPGISSETISLYIYHEGLQFFNVTYGATLSFVLLVIVTVFITVFIRIYPGGVSRQ